MSHYPLINSVCDLVSLSPLVMSQMTHNIIFSEHWIFNCSGTQGTGEDTTREVHRKFKPIRIRGAPHASTFKLLFSCLFTSLQMPYSSFFLPGEAPQGLLALMLVPSPSPPPRMHSPAGAAKRRRHPVISSHACVCISRAQRMYASESPTSPSLLCLYFMIP